MREAKVNVSVRVVWVGLNQFLQLFNRFSHLTDDKQVFPYVCPNYSRQRVECGCPLNLLVGFVGPEHEAQKDRIPLVCSRVARFEFNRSLELFLCFIPLPLIEGVHETEGGVSLR